MARIGHMIARSRLATPEGTGVASSSSSSTAAQAQVSELASGLSAMHWFRRAEDADDVSSLPSALLGMASLFLHGNGTLTDYTAAHELLQKATKAERSGADTAEAKWLLGVMWAQGVGMPRRDMLQAQRLWTEAAEVREGSVWACFLRSWLVDFCS